MRYVGLKIVHGTPALKAEVEKEVSAPIHGNHDGDTEGYRVVYEGGYVSWCPKTEFEKANRPIDSMSFGMVIEMMKRGARVARKGWNGKGMYLEIQTPDENSKMTLPYIWMWTACENRVPWLASQTDMLADDWEIVE